MTDKNGNAEQLTELERLAKAATPGPWRLDEYDGYIDILCNRERFPEIAEIDSELVLRNVHTRHDAAFIAACSPDVVLGLLYQRLDHSARADVAQAEMGAVREALGLICWAPHKDTLQRIATLTAERDEWAATAQRMAEQLTDCGRLLGAPLRDADREKIGDRWDPRTFYDAMTSDLSVASNEREQLRAERDLLKVRDAELAKERDRYQALYVEAEARARELEATVRGLLACGEHVAKGPREGEK